MKTAISKIMIVFIALWALFIFNSPLSYSSILQILTKKELVNKADSIVVGKVVEEYSDWDKNGRFIVTYIRLKVLEDIKGTESGAQEVIIKKGGGRVGNREMIVHGSARFTVGEKTLLFLGKDSNGFKNVIGLSLGKFRIVKDPFSGEEFAVNPAEPDIKLFRKGAQGKLVEDNSVGQGKKILLKNFIDEIKRELKGGEN